MHEFVATSDAASRDASDGSGPVLVVAGLAFEARIARACRGVEVLYGVGAALTDPASPLGRRLSQALANVSGIVSFGTAGGLDPRWAPGDCVLATQIVTERHGTGLHDEGAHRQSSPAHSASSAVSAYEAYATDASWLAALSRALPQAHHVSLFGAPSPVVSAEEKALLFARSQAGAVDMESHHLARLAAMHGIPFVACRVVIDRSSQNVPAAALAGMSPDGETHLMPVLASLLKHPSQLPALIRLGQDAGRARRALKAIGAQLPERFALP